MNALKWLGVALCLAACGADGEPVTPTAGLGIGITPNGITAGANIGLRKGPLRIGLAL